VEQLEGLLLEADASWSDTQQLFDRCMQDPAEAERVRQAARLLQPAYVRGRAAGGVWEAITVATSNQTTVLDATASVSDADVDAIMAQQPQWTPPPDSDARPIHPGPDGSPVWLWGTGPAERVLRLILRAYRERIDAETEWAGADAPEVATLKSWLKVVNGTLERVLAIRDALTDRVASAGFTPTDPPATITARINTIFADLAVPAALGAEIAGLPAHLTEHVETALAVEIVSRCTSARTPLQRSAPFRFLRLGPDVDLPLLDHPQARRNAVELGDRILFGTQVGHFGAFGAEDWRRWDWLMGRLHGAAHLGRLLGEDDEGIRETQLAILRSEGPQLSDVTAQIQRLSHTFAPGPGTARRALLQMRDELNQTHEGQETIRGLADRLIAISPGLTPAAGQWIHAVLARDHTPTRPIQRWARWYTRAARNLLWQRLVRNPALGPAPRPWFLARWPIAALFLLATVFATAAVVTGGLLALLFAGGAGATLAFGMPVLVTRWWLDRKRLSMRQKVGDLLPPLPPVNR
jgi:Protein of unknown function (DUF3376)